MSDSSNSVVGVFSSSLWYGKCLFKCLYRWAVDIKRDESSTVPRAFSFPSGDAYASTIWSSMTVFDHTSATTCAALNKFFFSSTHQHFFHLSPGDFQRSRDKVKLQQCLRKVGPCVFLLDWMQRDLMRLLHTPLKKKTVFMLQFSVN